MKISLRLATVLLGAALGSACAGIPSSGPVQQVANDTDLGQSAVRYSPARPLLGASPEQIVRGYLDAMLAFPASSRTASAYLTPAAARKWSASSRVQIYSEPDVVGSPDRVDRGASEVQPLGPQTVRIGFTVDAELDAQGRYTRRGTAAALDYRLERVEGQWRIANPQDGLLVNRKFFADYYRTFNLYYFDRPGRRLVPDPVHLVVGDQLATTLMTSLVGGPPGDPQATRTYVPDGAGLRPSVPVSAEGVADVEFTRDLRDLNDSERNHLSAQIVWTLRQVPEVQRVQIVGRSTALTASGDEVQPVQAWGGFGPSTVRGRAHAVTGGAVVEIDDGVVRPISGPWGQDARDARFVAVSEAGVAAVLPGRDRVRVTNRAGEDARTVPGTRFIGPTWDSDGTLWLVDQAPQQTRVRIVGSEGPDTIDVGGVADLQVESFKPSPEGTRYLIAGGGSDAGQLYVGRIVRDARDRVVALGEPMRVFTSAREPHSASWSSSSELMFLADSQSGVQVYRAAIDGSETTSEVSRNGSLLPDVGADTLVAGEGESPILYVTDAQNRLWVMDPSESWRLVETPRVTGLSYGR